MYNLKVVTPNETVFDGPVESVTAPGALGYLGILTNHAPLVTPVTKGTLTFRDASGKTEKFQVEGGFLEVLKNRVLILTDLGT